MAVASVLKADGGKHITSHIAMSLIFPMIFSQLPLCKGGFFFFGFLALFGKRGEGEILYWNCFNELLVATLARNPPMIATIQTT